MNPANAGDVRKPSPARGWKMRVFPGLLMILGVVAGLAACGGTEAPVDDGNNFYDVLILFDSSGEDTWTPHDTGDRDHSIAVDEGSPVDTHLPPDQGGVDTNVAVDIGGVDTNQPQDTTTGQDTNTPEDTVQPDNGAGIDTTVPEDTTDPEDTYVPDCSGSCAYGTDKNWCFDGGSLCECTSAGSWTSSGCTGVCTANNMVGDLCVTNSGGAVCNCQYDCSNSTLVQGQCTDLVYTPCTCGNADPCNWQNDDYCDKLCEMAFPDDYFVETADCECFGTCSATTFSGFCDNDGGACNCDLGSQTSTNCTTWCGDMAADLRAGEWCYTYSSSETTPPEAFCSCENFDCDDTWGVDMQCENLIYTPCTCAADNPCLWIGDGYCDSPTCDELYPGQTNFDDNASDC